MVYGVKHTGVVLVRVLLTSAMFCALSLTPDEAAARTFYMRATTAGEATQWRRLDLGVEASRPLLLGLELGGWTWRESIA